MPVLPNPRHERFAAAIAQGETADAAYTIAGYTENRANAARLKSNEHIKARIEELQSLVSEKVVEEMAIDKAVILRELSKIAMAPLDHDYVKPSDKRAACTDYARIQGWVIERREVGEPGEFDALAETELSELIQEEMAGLGLAEASDTQH